MRGVEHPHLHGRGRQRRSIPEHLEHPDRSRHLGKPLFLSANPTRQFAGFVLRLPRPGATVDAGAAVWIRRPGPCSILRVTDRTAGATADARIIAVPCLTTNRNVLGPRQIACLYIGTPISAPVWTVDYAKSIDPETFIDDSIYPEELGDTIFDGTTLYVTFSAQGADFATDFERVRLCQTANLASPADGWTAATIFSLSVDSPPGFNFVGQELRTVAAFIPSGAPSPVGIDCDSPPDGQVGVAYSHAFPATGGTEPYTFALTAGALPDGVTLDTATGIAAGTPTLAGLFSFTIEVTDADANTAHVDCSILIGLSIVCGNPPAGRVGVPYSHTFPATGGTAPYTFAITAGALLNGLTLDPNTGTVSGTPNIPGTGITTFTIQVTDAVAATASVACSIAVLPAALKITLRGVRRVAKAECEPEAERTDAPEPTPRKGRVL
jgi:hypothetical protein